MQESDKKLEIAEHNLRGKERGGEQRCCKQGEGDERGAVLLEVIIASLFLLLMMSAGNRLLGLYHLNYQKLFMSHQVLMQKQNER